MYIIQTKWFAVKQKRCVYGMVDIGKQDVGTAPQTRTILTGVSDLCEWPVEMTLTFRLIPYRLTLCQCFSVSLNRFGLLRYYKHIQCQISGVLSAGYKHWKHFTWTEHLNEHKFDKHQLYFVKCLRDWESNQI